MREVATNHSSHPISAHPAFASTVLGLALGEEIPLKGRHGVVELARLIRDTEMQERDHARMLSALLQRASKEDSFIRQALEEMATKTLESGYSGPGGALEAMVQG